ncbi:hypothetical protein [Lutibacter sp.]
MKNKVIIKKGLLIHEADIQKTKEDFLTILTKSRRRQLKNISAQQLIDRF